MQSLFANIKSSTGFLSRLPVQISDIDGPLDFARSACTFPIAGIIISIPVGLFVMAASYLALPDIVIAVLAVTLSVLVTGGLHEDGLADTADGVWGGNTVERRLAIMRDSSIGTYGVIALVLSLMLRTCLLYLILNSFGGFLTALILGAIFSLSRTAMLIPWTRLPAARTGTNSQVDASGKETSGLSVRFGAPDGKTLGLALLYSIPAVALLIVSAGVVPAATGIVIAIFTVMGILRLSQHYVAGHTGDILGATQQLSELGLLIGLVWTM